MSLTWRGRQERGAVGPFLEGEGRKCLSKNILHSQRLLKSLWLHIYCRRLAGLGNLSHEEISTRRHNLPSPPDRGSRCPRQGAGKLLLRAPENSRASRRRQQPSIFDIPPWREEPFEQGRSGRPPPPASALTACAVHTLATGPRHLPSLVYRTSAAHQPARFLQLPTPPWRTGSGCLLSLPGRLCRVSAPILRHGCVKCYGFMLDCCCGHADGFLQALLFF